ncbi:MAG: hypothetical protein AAGF99_05055 [Bacteroidota bacterium]
MRLVLLCVLFGFAVGCAPSISPLYRDFAPPSSPQAGTNDGLEGSAQGAATTLDEAVLMEGAARALLQADWTLAGTYGASTLRTEPRTVSNLGLYRTEVTLEVIPLSGGYVRVHIHPYRHYLVGGRSKLPYLSPGLRRALLPGLEKAFEAEGLQMLGTARKRDQADT